MIEDHSAVGVSHFEGERRSVFEVRQMIRGEAVSQCVVRSLDDVGCGARGLELLAEVVWRDFAGMFTQRQQPLAQIRLYLHETLPRRLGFRCRDFDQAVVEVNL